MTDQEIVAITETQAETPSLFDELAGLVPEERQAEYYRVIAHTRTLSPNDEMLRILEAMGVLALLTRETPAAIAAERKVLRKILESSASQASEVENRMESYTTRLESRLTQLPKELENRARPTQNCEVAERESAAVLSEVWPPRYRLSSFSILRRIEFRSEAIAERAP